MLLKPIEHQLQSLQMLIKGFRDYDEVIKINQEVSEVQISKATGHESLKGGGGSAVQRAFGWPQTAPLGR